MNGFQFAATDIDSCSIENKLFVFVRWRSKANTLIYRAKWKQTKTLAAKQLDFHARKMKIFIHTTHTFNWIPSVGRNKQTVLALEHFVLRQFTICNLWESDTISIIAHSVSHFILSSTYFRFRLWFNGPHQPFFPLIKNIGRSHQPTISPSSINNITDLAGAKALIKLNLLQDYISVFLKWNQKPQETHK